MYKLKWFLACILIAGTILSSCKSHQLIPGFTMGMSEQELKSSKENKLATGEFIKSRYSEDSSSFIYNWRLLDTTIYTSVAFNNDGAPFGNLRICVININDSLINRVLPQPYNQVKYEESDREFILNADRGSTGTQIVYSTCPEVKFRRVLAYLQSNYGKQDSITYQINKYTVDSYPFHEAHIGPPSQIIMNDTTAVEDTVYTKYHFHNSKSKIVLRRSKIFPPSQIISFSHISSVVVYQMSNSYESELAKIIDEKKKGLKPSDIISAPIYYQLENRKDANGYKATFVMMTMTVGMKNRRTFIESREISSIKGRIVIKDIYDEVLKTIDDVEYETNGLTSKYPGMDYALDDEAVFGNTTTYHPWLEVSPRFDSQKFQDAIRNNRKLKIEFVPDAIRFLDGSVLK